MIIEFRSRRLRKCYESHREAQRAWGREVAVNYIKRIDLLQAIHELEDLAAFPQLHYEALTGDRLGRHSIRLTGMMRLIFSLRGERLEIIRIEEVSKHYGH